MAMSRDTYLVFKMNAFTSEGAILGLLERLEDMTRVVMTEASPDDGEDWLRTMTRVVEVIRDGLSDMELRLSHLRAVLTGTGPVAEAIRGDGERRG